MPLPTLFFTRDVYAIHAVRHTFVLLRGEEEAKLSKARTGEQSKRKVKDSSLHERIQGNWKQLSGSVRHEWGKLTLNDVEQVKGDVEVLVGRIEERYGVTRAEARKQIDMWAARMLAHHIEQKRSQAEQSQAAES
jgi:uncharacterized protein YjbJ (UPF0337 family)